MILNPYNFVPLTAHIKLEIYYSNELEHRCSKGVSLMAEIDIFTIQEINLDKKTFHLIISSKKLKLIGIMHVQSIQVTTFARFIMINTLTFRYSYA